MTRKILGRIMTARSFVLAMASFAALALSAFDTPYLTFRSASSFSIYGTSSRWTGDGGYLEYATSNPTDAGSWTTWTGSSISAGQSDGQYYIYLRGKGIASFNPSGYSSSTMSLTASRDVYCEGDIETLRGYDGDVPAMGAKCYMYMFNNWSRLKSAPVLSATTLANNCYESMFYFAGITNAPALPATTLADRCYYQMFSYCSSLTAVPSLPATTLTSECYKYMFNGCSQLVTPPALPATTLAEDCYGNMFQNCTALKSMPALPATTAADSCYWNMFSGCTALEVNTSGPGVEWSIPSEVGLGASSWNSSMLANTGGSFTGNPVAGTTYKVASALPQGEIYQVTGAGTLTPVFAGSSYVCNLSATVKNGTAPYTFAYAGGTLPLGLEVSGSTLSGTPTIPGRYNFTLTVTDDESHVWNDAPYTLFVMQPLVSAEMTFLGGDGTSATTNCLVLNTDVVTWESGWYVVTNSLDYGTGGITIVGDVNLVLADGASLTVVGASKKAGINVAPGNSLTIFGQAEGSGALSASGYPGDTSSAGGAGIGGNDHEDCGTITINGGTVTASASNNYGAGIGGGYYGAGGTVTINGGTVTATGVYGGAGIGGGNYGAGGTVTINGGTVTATGGSSSANTSSGPNGIGRGYHYSSTVSRGTLTVGPAVSVKAGSTANPTTEIGRGGTITIGTQRYFYVETLSMTQIENALASYAGETKEWNLAETIAGGATPYTFSGTVPSGLELTSAGVLSGAVAAAGSYPFTLTVTDGAADSKNFTYTLTVTAPDPITETQTTLSATVGKAKEFDLSATVSGGVPSYTFAIKSGSSAPDGFSLLNGVLSGTAASAVASYSFTVVVTDTLGNSKDVTYTFTAAESTGFTDDDPEEPASGDSVDCRTADGVVRSRTCNLLTASSTVWENSWYYVAPNTTLSIPGVTVNGKVSLILGDGATLTVQGTSSKAGIRVAVEGSVTNSLTIYCQGAGTGKLVAKGGSAGAGIGGDNKTSGGTGIGDCGKVTIYGGVIEATGSGDAAGIGGGDWRGNGGTVAVYGGTVTATAGSSSAAGVGRGWTGNDGVLTVGERILVKAGSSANPTTELPHGENGAITLSGQRYFTFETTGPAPLSQMANAFAAYVGDAFSLSLADTVSGGTPTYTFTKKSGNLPAGLAFDAGVVSGTPTAAATETVVFTVEDSGIGSDAQSEDFTYTITVTAKPKSITYKNGETTISGLVPSNYVEGVGATLPVTATGAAGYSFAGWYDNSGLSGSPVSSISAVATGPQTFWASWTATVYTVTYMTDSTTPITDQNLQPTTYTIESATLDLPASATKAGKGFYGWYTNSVCTGNSFETIPHGSTGDKTFYAKWGAAKGDETYIDGSGTPQVVECAELASDSTALSTGWYIAKGSVTIPSKVTVSGNVKIVLADDATLTVNSSAYGAAIEVKGENSLTIYTQAKGNGALTVTASNGPGIGSNDSANPCGTITIYGGNVTVTGSYAGIGGGYGQPGGNVYVYGGTVIATGGGSDYSGIGGCGSRKTEGTLVVGENQVVFARANNYSSPLFTLKPRGAGGAITLGGEQYYRIVTPETASVSYRDTDGIDKPATCRFVSEDFAALPGGWYAVTNNLTLGCVTVASNETVNLIIADGVTLNATGTFYNAGIYVPVGSSLAIYGQSGGTGAISATGGYYGAGIGGRYGDGSNHALGGAGTITINACTIAAQGGNYAAGIGGGMYGDGGTVTVNGGTVTAISGVASAAGIGGGTVFSGSVANGTLTVGPLMAVTAGTNATDAVALEPDGSGAITLSGEDYYHIERSGPVELTLLTGELQALKGGQASWTLATTVGGGTQPYTFAAKTGFEPPAFLTLENGVLSGIPTATGTYNFTIVVTDDASASIEAEYTLTVENPPALAATQTALGNVAKNATTNFDLATTVSGGIPGYTFAEKVANSLPSGLTLTSAGVLSGAPTTAGTYPFTIVVTDSASPANTIEVTYTLVVKEVYSITYKARDGETNINLAPATYVEGTGVAADGLPVPTESGWTFIAWYDNSGLSGDPVEFIPANATSDMVLYSKWEEYATGDVSFTFTGADGNPRTETCTVIDDTMTTLSTGWYVVYNNVTFNNKALTVSGDVKIVLKDGRSMTATGSSGHAGIKLAAGNTLTIYGQSAGTGSLSATAGGYNSAGIGGDDGESAGTLIVYGGNVTGASGKYADAAGIGGGRAGNGGTVIVHGGTVTATSGSNGAGIGGGDSGLGGTVTIYGGTVNATGSMGAGIGGGRYGNGGTVTVNGGSVTAASGTSSVAGIGGGNGSADNGTLTVGEYVTVLRNYTETNLQPVMPDANGVVALTSDRYYVVKYAPPVPVTYRDASGVDRTTNCLILTSASTQLSSGWYAVTNNLDFKASIWVDGDVNLVIADGATQSVTCSTLDAGICVTNGNSLTIYGQAGGTGVINATGGSGGGAGIGGGYGMAGGMVTINGGIVTATGGYRAAGIGGGQNHTTEGTLKVAANLVVSAGASENPSTTLERDDVTGEVTLGGEQYYTVAPLSTSTPFSITYRSNGGTLNLAPATYTYGAGLAELPSPAAGDAPAGCTFGGWYEAADFSGSAVTSIASGTIGSKTFYAKWLAPYVDENGQAQTTPFTMFADTMTTLSSGWYLVDGEFSISDGELRVSGSVNLILADGAVLSVTGKNARAGIEVSSGNSLAIYAQSAGSGVLNAVGGFNAAGIGGSNYTGRDTCGTVTINGGTVNATGSIYSGAGIGGCDHGNGGTVTVNGGRVTATGGSKSGIGRGSYASTGSHGTLVVTKANLVVTAGSSANPTDTPARDSVTGEVTLSGEQYYVIAPVSGSSEFAITYMSLGAPLSLSPATYAYGTGVATLPTPAAGDTPAGCTFGGWYVADNFSGSAVTSIASDAAEAKTFYAKWNPVSESKTYIDENGDAQTETCTAVTVVSDTLTTGSYFVPVSMILNNKTLVVSGEVKLVLTDGNTLTITGVTDRAAINVSSGNTLKIYAQSSGTGVLNAYGRSGGAGIGGDEQESGGAVEVYGGTVLADGNFSGDGVGGGRNAVSHGTLKVAPAITVRKGSLDNLTVVEKDANGYALFDGYFYTVLISPPANYTINYMDGATPLALEPSSYREGTGATLATPADREGYLFAGWYDNALFTGSAVTEIPANVSGEKTFYGRWYALEETSYIDVDGTPQTIDAAPLAANMPTLVSGAYVVKSSMAFTEGLVISGDVKLIIADGAVLTVTQSSSSKAGIEVGSGNTLSVYVQSGGTGAISAAGGDYGAGIGAYKYNTPQGSLKVGAGLVVKSGASAGSLALRGRSTVTGAVTLDGSQYFTVGAPETWDITYLSGDTPLNLAPATYTEGTVTPLAPMATRSGYAFAGWYTNSTFIGSRIDRVYALESGDKMYWAKWYASEDTTFVDGNGAGVTTNAAILSTDMTVLETGVYVAKGTLDFNSGITILGDVTIILADDAAVTATAPQYSDKAGIAVYGANSLTICAQSAGTGTLLATGNATASGIGGNYTTGQSVCGTVRVYGGTVTGVGGIVGIGLGGANSGNGTLVIGSDRIAKTGASLDNLSPLPRNETTGEVVNESPLKYFVIEKYEEEILPLMQAEDTLGPVTAGSVYGWNMTNTVCYGVKPYSFALKSGSSLPSWLTLEDGILSGTPPYSGNWTFTLVVTDSTPEEAQQIEASYTLRVNPDPTRITQMTSELDGAIVGFTYTASLVGTFEGGTAPYRYEQYEPKDGDIVNPYPPAGIKLVGNRLTGIPTDFGANAWTIIITVTDANNVSTNLLYSISVAGSHGTGTGLGTWNDGVLDWSYGFGYKALSGESRAAIYGGFDSAIAKTTAGAVTVPTYIGTIPVTCVGDWAFIECDAITSVTIPDTVTAIGDLAFGDCPSLESVTIPQSVVQIGDWAFDACTSLETIYVQTGDADRVRALVEATDPEADFSGIEFVETDLTVECTVTFDANGGTCSESSRDVLRGHLVGKLPASGTQVSRPNWMFSGWYTAAEGGTQVSASTVVTDDVTYYAHWTKAPDPVFEVGANTLMSVDLNGNVDIVIPDSLGIKTFFNDRPFSGKKITSVVLPSTLTSIAVESFKNCTSLTNVVIPSSVTRIATDAFIGCSALKEIVIPDSVTEIHPGAFEGCTSLTNIVLPSGLTQIRTAVFKDCTSLTDLPALPASVGSFDSGAFQGCTGFTSVTIPSSVTNIGPAAFASCSNLVSIAIPDSVTSIDDAAFRGCTSLETVNIPSGVSNVSQSMFAHCTSLESISLGSNITNIGEYAFWECSSLASITIPKGVTVGTWAFNRCTALQSVNISGEVKRRAKTLRMSASPKGLLGAAPADPEETTVAKYAFYGCSGLEDVIIGAKVSEIGGGAFSGCNNIKSFEVETGNENYSSESGMLLKEGVELVSAFGNETSLTVPSGVTNILEGAFADYVTLTNVTLQSGVVAIGEGAFSNATQFAVITIPSSVTAIGANAFYGTKLATAYVATGDVSRVRGLITASGYNTAGVTFIEALSPVQEEPKPSIDGDSAATVTGNATDGFVVTPSTTSGTVEVVIPSGIDAEKVTVEVPPTATVKPNGANVKVVKEANATSYDITAFLDIPAPNASGVIDLNAATVKPAIVKEALDPTKEGVNIDLTPANPSITTAATRPGLTYTFSEGTTLEGMTQKATKVGDGTTWTPTITVKGGTSGFYSIGVTK